jgi:hypothetical protein
MSNGAVRNVMFAGTFSGAVLSTLGLISVMARLISVHDTWMAIVELAQMMPSWVDATIDWLGAAFERVIAAYREVIYPVVHSVLQYISVRLTPLQIDMIFIGVFSMAAASRRVLSPTMFARWEDYEVRGVRRFLLRSVNWPVEVIIFIGAIVVGAIDALFELATRGRFRPFWRLYMILPPLLGQFVICTICSAIVLTALFTIDWIYSAFFAA